MTRKRLLAICGALGILVFMVLVLLTVIPPRPGITKRNFDRIQQGMTKAEVEALLGGQAGYSHADESMGNMLEAWSEPDRRFVFVWFHEGRVSKKKWQGPQALRN
jgi:hypothetical protein